VPLVGAVVVAVTGSRERQGRRRWLGLLVGIGGVAALVGLDVGQVDVLSVAEVGGVAVCYAVGRSSSRRLSDACLGVSRRRCDRGAPLCAVAASRWPSSMPSAHVLESVLGLAVVCTALAFLVFFALLGDVGPVLESVVAYVYAAVAAVLGVAILSEHLSAGMLVGFALILVGSVFATGRGPEPLAES
jgi:drug/metabolite transporter (DMT)-like permease